MTEFGPGNRWAIVNDIKADPGGSMAIIEREVYREPCMTHHPGIPVYTKTEIRMIQSVPQSATLFRAVQRIKKVFPKARVVSNGPCV